MEQDLTERLIGFLRTYYSEEVGQLANHYPREQRSLHIDYDDVYQFDPVLADDVVESPDNTLGYFEQALALYDLPVPIDLSDAHVRIYNLPEPMDVSEVGEHENLGTLVEVSGQVKKISKVKPEVQNAAFACQMCGTVNRIVQSGANLEEPHECQGCERKGPFTLDVQQSEWLNHQYTLIQQTPEQSKGGNAEHEQVHLRDDLTEEFQPGDRIRLTGVVDVEEPGNEQSTTFETQIDGEAVVLEDTDYEDIDIQAHKDEIREIANGEHGDPYELLVQSINPKHKGDEELKLAIVLQLFGGWERKHPDGSRKRGDSHILMLGDPGCGKSTFLHAVNEIAPRSTYASGKGATAAGMTAAAVPDNFGDGEWSLEAGALVLSNGGVACVDEIDKMKEDAVSSLHSALESQTVHINKAGINAELEARTALLAAGNPKHGRFDTYEPIGEQIDLPPSLLSRFDLMFMMTDQPDPDRDSEIVEHMVKGRRASAKYTLGEDMTEDERVAIEPIIDRETLRPYIAYAKESCFPMLQDADVEQKIKDYYVSFRAANASEDNHAVPVTPRNVEGILRLAEASARIRLSETISLEDVERAVSLIESSMRDVGMDPETGEFDIDLVETGESRSQRARRKQLENIIKDGQPITRDEILQRAADRDLEQSKVKGDLQTFLDQGKMYDSGGGEFRWTTGSL